MYLRIQKTCLESVKTGMDELRVNERLSNVSSVYKDFIHYSDKVIGSWEWGQQTKEK